MARHGGYRICAVELEVRGGRDQTPNKAGAEAHAPHGSIGFRALWTTHLNRVLFVYCKGALPLWGTLAIGGVGAGRWELRVLLNICNCSSRAWISCSTSSSQRNNSPLQSSCSAPGVAKFSPWMTGQALCAAIGVLVAQPSPPAILKIPHYSADAGVPNLKPAGNVTNISTLT